MEIQLTQEEFGELLSSLETTIETLENRFKDESGYVHPALKYKKLYAKLNDWYDELPICKYNLQADPI